MSTTLSENVAISYATGGDTSTASTIIESTMGMIDRGAQLDWLSQYPHEKEILLPPLTAIEVQNITEADELTLDGGKYQVARVTVRLNCNLVSMTLEKLMSVRKKEVKALLTIIKNDLLTREPDADTQARLSKVKRIAFLADGQKAAVYNDNIIFTEYVRQAVTLLPKNGDEVHSLEAHGEVIAVGCTGHLVGQFISAAAKDNRFVLWSLSLHTQNFSPTNIVLDTSSDVSSMMCIPDAHLVVCGLFDGSLVLHSFELLNPLVATVRGHAHESTCTSLSHTITDSDLQIAAGFMDGSVLVWSAGTRRPHETTDWVIVGQWASPSKDETPALKSDSLVLNPAHHDNPLFGQLAPDVVKKSGLIFAWMDTHGDGHVRHASMQRLAMQTGDGQLSADDYAMVCRLAGCDPARGLSAAGLLRVYTDLDLGDVREDFELLGLGHDKRPARSRSRRWLKRVLPSPDISTRTEAKQESVEKTVRALLILQVDGENSVVSGSFDGNVRVLVQSSGTLLCHRELRARAGGVEAVTALAEITMPTSEVSHVAAGSESGDISIWNICEGVLVRISTFQIARCLGICVSHLRHVVRR